MKFLLVNKYHYVKGGAERYYFNLAEALNAVGDQTVFLSMKDKRNYPCEQEKYFLSHSSSDGSVLEKAKFFKNMLFSKEGYKKTAELLKAEKPDAVIVNNFHKHLTFSVIKAIKDYDKNIPVVWVAHDYIAVCPSFTLLDGNGNFCEECKKDLHKCIEKKCVKGSKIISALAVREAKYIKKNEYYDLFDYIICPSEYMKSKLCSLGTKKTELYKIFNPLPPDYKCELNRSDKGYLLFFGRLSKEKGIDGLIRAVCGTNSELIIAGEGKEEKSLKNLCKTLGANNVSFAGFKKGKELEELIKNCKYVCLPSVWSENCPYSVIESFANGKPVIARKSGGVAELVKDGETGILAKENESFKGAIDRATSIERKEYNAMCEKARDFAKNNFDAIKYVEKLKKILSLN